MEGYRKVIIAGAMLVLCLAVVIWKGDVPPGLVTILEFLFPVFVAGNAIEHMAAAYSAQADVAPAPAPVPVDTAEVSAAVASLHENVQSLHATSADIQQGVATMNQAMTLLVQRNAEYLRQQAAQPPYLKPQA